MEESFRMGETEAEESICGLDCCGACGEKRGLRRLYKNRGTPLWRKVHCR